MSPSVAPTLPHCQSERLCCHLSAISSHKLVSFPPPAVFILLTHFTAKLNFICFTLSHHICPTFPQPQVTACLSCFLFCNLMNFRLLLDSLPTPVPHVPLSSYGQHCFLHPSPSPFKFFLKWTFLSPPSLRVSCH